MFNPNEHMMKLKGKDYLQVMWRLVWFREDHPDYGINAEALSIEDNHAVFKAVITDNNGMQISCGHGSESSSDFHDFIEKAETKAIGRALAMLGYGTQFAPELDEGDRIVDSPVAREKKQTEDKQPIGAPELFKAEGYNSVKSITIWCKQHGIGVSEFGNLRKALIASGIVDDIPSDKLTAQQASELFRAIANNFPDALKTA